MTRATEAEIAHTLELANMAVLQAEAERDHWRRAAGLMETEIRMIIGVWLKRSRKTRILITADEFTKLDRNKKLWVGNPDPGVRQYELREGKQQMIPESNFILPPGAAGHG